MKYFYTLLFFAIPFLVSAQCAIIPLELDQRVQESDLTIEGSVISGTSFRINDNDFIKTRWTIDVSRIFKGNASQQIEVVTLGGAIGTEVHRASHGLQLKAGMAGIFHLNNTGNNSVFTPYENLQGFIKYDPVGRIAYHPGGSFETWADAYSAIENITGQRARVLGDLPSGFTQSNASLKSVTNFSPTSLNAGVGDVLTITGTNFGSTRGNGNVFFRNANDGGATFSIVPVPEQYLSWSDTQITLEVPTGAGTGTFAVQNDSGSNFFTSSALTINYNHTNIVYDPDNDGIDNAYETQHYDENGNGGFSFRYNTEFINTPSSPSSPDATAPDNMDRILERWKCSSGINFTRGSDTTIDTNPENMGDDENVVRFDNGSELGGGGTLAYALSRYFACGTGSNVDLYTQEVDIVVNDDYTWHYGDESTIGSNEYDFYTVILHEVGHALQLGHVIDTQKVMHFSIGSGQTNRDLAESDFEGSLYVANKSIETTVCSQPAMTRGSCTFVYDNAAWSPFNPEGTVNVDNDYEVQNGSTSFGENVIGENFQVDSGATYDQTANSMLILYGNLENNGTASFDRVSLAGNTAQSILGSSTLQIESLELNNAAGATLNNTVEVSGWVMVNEGTLTANGNLVLLNSDTNEAMVGPLTNAGTDITGDVEVQRFYPANRAWRFIAPSVTTTTPIVDNWQESKTFTAGLGTHITGSTTGSNGFDATQTGNPSLFLYDNTGSNGWFDIANTDTNTLTAGEAYRIYVRGDRDPSHLTSNTSSDTRLRAFGTLATGDQNFSNLSTSAGGFSFIGNPYHAAVDMETVLNRSQNLTSNIYVWDPNVGSQGAYVTVNTATGSTSNGSSEANKFAQVQQAFFVETASAGAAEIRFRESDKNLLEGGTAVNDVQFASHIKGILNRTDVSDQSTRTRDGFALYFSSNADGNIAGKLENPDENLSMLVDGKKSSLWERGLPTEGEAIALEGTNFETGSYELQFILRGMTGQHLYLIDTVTGMEHLLEDGQVNNIPFSVDHNKMVANRFSLRFGKSSETEITYNAMSLYPNPSDSDVVSISGIQGDHATVKVYSLMGNLLMQQDVAPSQGTVTLEKLSQLSQGVYFLEVEDGTDTTTLKMIRR